MPAAIDTGLFDSLCTILGPPTAQGPTGNPTGPYAPIIGLTDIPCMDAPPSIARVQATEVKAVEEIMAVGLRHVLLNQCFADAPQWAGRNYRASIDGVVMDLLGAENDSQTTQTRLDLKLVTI